MLLLLLSHSHLAEILTKAVVIFFCLRCWVKQMMVWDLYGFSDMELWWLFCETYKQHFSLRNVKVPASPRCTHRKVKIYAFLHPLIVSVLTDSSCSSSLLSFRCTLFITKSQNSQSWKGPLRSILTDSSAMHRDTTAGWGCTQNVHLEKKKIFLIYTFFYGVYRRQGKTWVVSRDGTASYRYLNSK